MNGIPVFGESVLLLPRLLALLVPSLLSLESFADPPVTADTSEVELTNFAIANYLGSGFYTSGNERLFILKIPLASELTDQTTGQAGLALKYPVMLGVGQIDAERDFPELGDIIDIRKFATLSVVPGREYDIPVSENWHLGPFVDPGIGQGFRQ